MPLLLDHSLFLSGGSRTQQAEQPRLTLLGSPFVPEHLIGSIPCSPLWEPLPWLAAIP